MSYLDLSIEEMHEAIINGKVTPEELVKESLQRAKDYQKEYNSFVTITEKEALDEVTKIDNNDSYLYGIPCAIKDNLSTKGILTTASSNILKDYIPCFDATVVSKLKESGSISIGKTVLDELAMGGTGTTGHTGIVRNPWNKERLIGGSSAGSCAAVASGIVPFAIGSDTGDSIRKPAIYGGIVGFKPTYGRISRFGLFSFACSLDHVGCFTRNVKDIAYVVDAIKGHDDKDMTSLENDNVKYSDLLDGNVKGKKVFYIKEIMDINNYEGETDKELEEVFKNFESVKEKCSELGMEVREESIDIRLLKAIFSTYMTISCAEATSNNSNLTGIQFGPRGEGKNIEEIMFDARTKGFSELIKRRFVLGSYVLQKENQEKLFLNAGRIRRLIVDNFNKLFEKYDAFILPGSSSIAPKFQSENIDKLSNRYLLLENHMAIGNFGGMPSITIPSGKIDNMPIGICITGKAKDDLNVLNIAYALENVLGYKGQIAGKENK